MPNARERVHDFLAEWVSTRVRAALLKLPQDRPDLLFFVLLAAVVMTGLYAGVFANHL